MEKSATYEPAERLKGYIMFELAFSLTKWPKWALVARFHHRSGMGGLIGDNMDASTALGFGIRYVFY